MEGDNHGLGRERNHVKTKRAYCEVGPEGQGGQESLRVVCGRDIESSTRRSPPE
jgi:hypothetical protein